MSQANVPTDVGHAPGTNGVPAPEPPVELAADGLPPWGEEALASLRELDWLDQQYNSGALRPYYGEHVVSANHTILSHHRRYGTALELAEAKAKELGINPERLTVYPVSIVDDILEVADAPRAIEGSSRRDGAGVENPVHPAGQTGADVRDARSATADDGGVRP